MMKFSKKQLLRISANSHKSAHINDLTSTFQMQFPIRQMVKTRQLPETNIMAAVLSSAWIQPADLEYTTFGAVQNLVKQVIFSPSCTTRSTC